MFGKAPRGATQRPPVREPSNQKLIPGWLWMIFGMLLGLFIMVLLYLWQPWRPASRPIDATQTITPDHSDEQTNQDYQFYDLLPKQQVTPVPSDAVPTDPQAANSNIIVAPPVSVEVPDVSPAQNAANADPAEINETTTLQYILQVNSYQNPDDADARRAEILLVGLPADVRQSKLADGSMWFRVVSGPFASRAEALNAQSLLQNSGIDSLVVEQRR
ncbi:SPOR domain-containing protein [Alkanindiges sp. WGS2144]|uniref:SPOR domain-containing protein n=1 Tax=Alkanindiges sp. WGS2144 TaxID=3366808 RepID=UPI00374FE8B4